MNFEHARHVLHVAMNLWVTCLRVAGLQEMLVDPVIAADGHTYDRAALQKWLQHSSLSPKLGCALPHNLYVPNMALKQIIFNSR